MSFLSGRTSLTTVQTGDIADDAVTLAKMAHGTASQNIAYDGSGIPVDVAAAGGAWAVIASGSFTSASSIDITDLSKTTRIVFYNITGGGDGYGASCKLSTDNGSTWMATNYAEAGWANSDDATYWGSQSNPGRTYLNPGLTYGDGTATEDSVLIVDLFNLADASAYTYVKTWAMSHRNGMMEVYSKAHLHGTAGNVDAFQLIEGSGTSLSGSYIVSELN